MLEPLKTLGPIEPRAVRERVKPLLTQIKTYFVYSWEHCLKIVLYSEETEMRTLDLEMATKLKDKQTSIVTVRDLLQTFATFQAPLFSHCRLPLMHVCLLHL
jgi:hypothetical protein